MADALFELPDRIGKVMEYLFVPEEDALSQIKEKIKSTYLITQAVQLRNKFQQLWNDLGFYGVPDKAPELTFKVSTIGTKSLAQFEKDIRISLDWYAPYKADIDAILSALMLLFYAYRLFVNLPAIITGTGGPAASMVKDVVKEGKES